MVHMEFHVPYFILTTSPPREDHAHIGVHSKPPRHRVDLSFLQIKNATPQDQKIYGILEAHMSFVICGVDDRRWSGYAFVDTESDGDDWVDRDCHYEGWHEDPITLGEQNANRPIWNPREYFLRIVQFRMVQVLENWKKLVRPVESSINQYVG